GRNTDWKRGFRASNLLLPARPPYSAPRASTGNSMSRQALNDHFLRTAFLGGVNAAYVEEMQTQYEKNPGSVSDEWRHFFESLREERSKGEIEQQGPSWAVPLERLEDGNGNGDLIAALTSDYDAAERTIRDKLQSRAYSQGFDMSPAASMRATQDSIRALM